MGGRDDCLLGCLETGRFNIHSRVVRLWHGFLPPLGYVPTTNDGVEQQHEDLQKGFSSEGCYCACTLLVMSVDAKNRNIKQQRGAFFSPFLGVSGAGGTAEEGFIMKSCCAGSTKDNDSVEI